MWGQKFGFVVGNALSFPFKQFGKIKGLFFATAILLMAVALIAFILFGGTIIALAQHSKLHPEMMSQAGVGAGFILFTLVGGLLLMFAMLPYLVGIIRAVVLDEKAVIVVGIVVNIFSWLVMFMAGMLFLPMAIMAGPNMMGSVTGMISMGVYGILYVLLTLATMMPGTALYGYIYLVVTGQVMFGEPEIKQVVEK
jgi:hypothetical protein